MEMPLKITLHLVNENTQWNATSNKSDRIVISQHTPEEALRLALINAGYKAPTDREAIFAARAEAAYYATGATKPYTYLDPQEWAQWERVAKSVNSVRG